ncbi:MAG TPA: PTS transporter subunit EIIB [Bacilli bacterium]|jgi:phosphotransferase system IIB component|nr:PTS transporter subunit EIIB [Bacilli bacterium]HOD60876.1 PTS transporter subunit EIIB [Bacilli bacterium]HOH61038.1 PTS transporter subunit EIIB [Bacilli bacterium]HPB49556.1 PTS transporter subunit EIIB [Bacilli bacterium]HPM14945.1 PTS transporter subunit EIIB [Bacilli bacterium]
MIVLAMLKEEIIALILLLVCIVPILLLSVFAIFKTINNKSKLAKKHELNIENEPKDLEQQKIFYNAYGGKENIIEISLKVSRITVKVRNIEKVNGEELKALGATGVLFTGDEVKCSFSDQAPYIYEMIKM